MRVQGSGLSGTVSRISVVSILSIFSKSRPRHRAGLTLVEVLFVMAVFAILIALVIGLGRYADSAARIHQARADLGEWAVALGRWHNSFGEYPRPPEATNVVWLASNTVYIARFTAMTEADPPDYADVGDISNRFNHAAFFRDLPFNDPWRQPYRYEAQDNATDPAAPLLDYRLYSVGSDGKDTTDHDNIFFSN